MTSARKVIGVVRASSAVRLLPGHTLHFVANDLAGATEIVLSTHYVEMPETEPVARELFVEVTHNAAPEDFPQARERVHELASTVVSVLSLAANAATDDLRIDLVFDASPDRSEHEFFQNVLLPEQGFPRSSRRVDGDAFLALMNALLESPERERLLRAVGQYQVALRHMLPGHELMTLAHLWMAVEAMTKAVLESELQRAGSREALLQEWDIPLQQLDGMVRQKLIFQSDKRAYSEAKEISDAFEHGFVNFAELRTKSALHNAAVAKYVREAILAYSGLSEGMVSRLLVGAYSVPIPCVSIDNYIRAMLAGPGDALAAEGYAYPHFEVAISFPPGAVVHKPDGSIDISPEYKVTSRLGEGVVGEVTFEMWGPANAGPPEAEGPTS
jgi:hypothetical protein